MLFAGRPLPAKRGAPCARAFITQTEFDYSVRSTWIAALWTERAVIERSVSICERGDILELMNVAVLPFDDEANQTPVSERGASALLVLDGATH